MKLAAVTSAKSFDRALAVLLPKKIGNPQGISNPATFQPNNAANIITIPTYRDHLTDLFTTRIASDSRALIKQLMIADPDTSSATNAFLTVADTRPLFLAKTIDGQIDRAGMKLVNQLRQTLFSRFDYQSQGYEKRHTERSLCEAMRYAVLQRGAIAAEAIITKEGVFNEIRLFDATTVQWREQTKGHLIPEQNIGSGDPIKLDYTTIFYEAFHQDPTSAYPTSPFVSAINTIAARQQVINDLYRLMQITGYPRIDVQVLEEVIVKALPPEIQGDITKRRQAVLSQINAVTAALSSLRPDQPFVHTDAIKVGMVNDKQSGMSLDISPVIEVLNAQNQAGLKTMATILGRGTSGVNTASVEARIFSLSADQLNRPIEALLSKVFTMMLRMTGSTSYVEVIFSPSEMRPDLELEPQRALKASRLREDLSLGIIDDDEYHLQMYGRIRPDSAPLLSGTNFATAKVDTGGVSPNADPLGRSIAPKGSKAANSN